MQFSKLLGLEGAIRPEPVRDAIAHSDDRDRHNSHLCCRQRWSEGPHALAEQIQIPALFGDQPPASIGGFLDQVFTTSAGWRLIVLGNAAGFVFAVIVLATTVVAFPLLLDRDVGAVAAIETSARAVIANPLQMALWGLIVAVLLVIGSIPLFAGLAVVVPVLGHATWHLYRKVVEPDRDAARRPM